MRSNLDRLTIRFSNITATPPMPKVDDLSAAWLTFAGSNNATMSWQV